MSDLRKVEIKKSKLIIDSLYSKKTVKNIAEEYGISPVDVQRVLVSFGIKKSKKPMKDYILTLVDDTIVENVESTATTQEPQSEAREPVVA